MLLLCILLSKKAILPIAENIERQKQFVTDAGHELKTPIAVILANTDALELHTGTSKWSANIRDQAERMSDLTKNLLTLARADEAGKVGSESEFSLSDLVKSSTELFFEAMETRSLMLESDIDSGVCIKRDKNACERIISILLDNAMRYAKRDSRVRLVLNGAKLIVENECDTLPTVPPEKLFDRFYREDKVRSGGSGYGIGLSAARALAEGMGCTITAEYDDTAIRFIVSF